MLEIGRVKGLNQIKTNWILDRHALEMHAETENPCKDELEYKFPEFSHTYDNYMQT